VLVIEVNLPKLLKKRYRWIPAANFRLKYEWYPTLVCRDRAVSGIDARIHLQILVNFVMMSDQNKVPETKYHTRNFNFISC